MGFSAEFLGETKVTNVGFLYYGNNFDVLIRNTINVNVN